MSIVQILCKLARESLPFKTKKTKTIRRMTTSWSDLENKDGVRFSLNAWPDDRQSAQKCVVPLGALVTPLKHIEDVQVRF
mgnify:CR=1 FL=1